ncbi:DUF3300 domain-containing protein [Erwinia endophytica]|uniref:DUF3300 domain-containing protein n=1 Tax=Erwinia endophytica TaxID=1563158 RepID=UPI001F041E27|nr:DUF3300 domain-containing protein [Erwinia endophytica]
MRRSTFNFPGTWVMVFLLPLAGCDQKSAETPLPPSTPPVTASTPVPAAPAVAATNAPVESATALYSLLAPVALFPDALLAQVLAASLHPDDVASACVWLLQNKTLSGDARRQAVDARDWAPAVKALTGFPDVLAQMARNLSWTRSLGDAYRDSPETVMNVVQILRQRAADSGALNSSSQQKVARSPASALASGREARTAPAVTKASGSPPAVPAPRQTITIQPASPDVVYVPVYGSAVYGTPPVAYPPGYSTGDMVATGLVSFTAGVMVGAVVGSHNDWGWGQWGMHWGPAPVVVYRQRTFVDRTVIRHDGFHRPGPDLAPGPVRLPHFAPVRGPAGPTHYAGGVAHLPMTPPVVHHRAVGPLREPPGRPERQSVHHPAPVREPGPVCRPYGTEKPLRYDPPLRTAPLPYRSSAEIATAGLSGLGGQEYGKTDERFAGGMIRHRRD